MTIKDELVQSLNETGMVEVITSDHKGTKLSVLCRQKPNTDKDWLKLVNNLLVNTEKLKTETHICRRYLLKNGKMVYGWHISFTGKSLSKDLKMVLAALGFAKSVIDSTKRPPQQPTKALPGKSAPRIKTVSTGVDEEGKAIEIKEMPLPWASKRHDMNIPSSEGKGAWGVGSKASFRPNFGR